MPRDGGREGAATGPPRGAILAVCLATLAAIPATSVAQAPTSSPQAGISRLDRDWRRILVEAGGLWWDEQSAFCNLNHFRRIGGSRRFDGRIIRTRYFRNPFTGRCRISEGFVQVGTAAVWSVRRGLLRMYFVFTGRVTVDTVRLVSYRRSRDALTVRQRGSRRPWYGCGSSRNPFPCL